jgi:hypothetical protein
MLVDRGRHLAELGHHRVGRGIDLAVIDRILGRDRGRPHLGQADATPGLLRLIGDIAVSDAAIVLIGRRMARAEEAVADLQALDPQRLEQCVVFAHGQATPQFRFEERVY